MARADRHHDRARDPFDPRHRDHRRIAVERVDDVERGAQALVGRASDPPSLRPPTESRRCRSGSPSRSSRASRPCRPRRSPARRAGPDVRPDRRNLPVHDQDGAAVDGGAGHRQHAAVDDRDRFVQLRAAGDCRTRHRRGVGAPAAGGADVPVCGVPERTARPSTEQRRMRQDVMRKQERTGDLIAPPRPARCRSAKSRRGCFCGSFRS